MDRTWTNGHGLKPIFIYIRVDFEYLNMEWGEAPFTEVFDDPKDRMSFIISNKQLPCNDEFIFVAKAYGVNGNMSC